MATILQLKVAKRRIFEKVSLESCKGGLVWKLRRLPLVMKLFSHLNAAHNFTQWDVLTRRMTKRQLRIEKWLRLPLPMKDGQGETPPVRLVVGSHPSPTPRNGAETN